MCKKFLAEYLGYELWAFLVGTGKPEYQIFSNYELKWESNYGRRSGALFALPGAHVYYLSRQVVCLIRKKEIEKIEKMLLENPEKTIDYLERRRADVRTRRSGQECFFIGFNRGRLIIGKADGSVSRVKPKNFFRYYYISYIE